MSILPASYSRLSLFEKCPLQFRFRYIDRLPTAKAPQAERGTKIHASIEGLLRGEKSTIHRAAKKLVPLVLEVRQYSPRIEYKLSFSRGFEKRLKHDSPGVWFTMVLDCAYMQGDTAYVQEWKSGKIYDEHEDQRKVYALGAIKLWNTAYAEATTYYLDKGARHLLHVDRPAATLIQQQLTERVGRMETQKLFSPRPGYYCSWCSYSKFKGGPCPVA